MQSKLAKGLIQNRGFTLVELMIVVAIIAILAAIAIPSYTKYVRSARATEAVSNLASIQSFEESYFSENDQYVTAGANPATFPTGGNRQPFNAGMAGWTDLGRVMPNNREVFFQYQITAGSVTTAPAFSPASFTHTQAGCTVATGNGASGGMAITALDTQLGVPLTANTFWFVATATGEQTVNGRCSLFIAVTDRPDITEEQRIE